MIRAVYDCNVIMSGIGWNGAARNYLKRVACRQVFLYVTDEILAEYEAVIPETLAEEMPKIDPQPKLAWIMACFQKALGSTPAPGVVRRALASNPLRKPGRSHFPRKLDFKNTP
jgi:hypothetical protein